jgi:YHS domain-containing protein
MKNILIIILFTFSIFSYSQDFNGIYSVTKILTSDDGEKILFITNDKIKGIIIMDNDDLKVNSSFKKIKKGKDYYFTLEVDEKKYRGENDGYAIISSSGKIKRIWDVKKDGAMPYIFTAKNVKGLYVENKIE